MIIKNTVFLIFFYFTPGFDCLCKYYLSNPWGTHNCSPGLNRSGYMEIPLFGSCMLSCSFLDRVYHYFCWEKGWDALPRAQDCFTETCMAAEVAFPWDWSWNCNYESVEGRVLKGTICEGRCLTGGGSKVVVVRCVGHNTWSPSPEQLLVKEDCPHFGCEPLSRRMKVAHGELSCHASGIHYCRLSCHLGYIPRGSSLFFCLGDSYKEKLLDKDLNEDYERKLACERADTLIFGESPESHELQGYIPDPDGKIILRTPPLGEDISGTKVSAVWFLGHLLLCWGPRKCRSLIVSEETGSLEWIRIKNTRWVIESNTDFIIEEEKLHVVGETWTTTYSGVTDKTVLNDYDSIDSFPLNSQRCSISRPNGDALILGSVSSKTLAFQIKNNTFQLVMELPLESRLHKCFQIQNECLLHSEHYLLTSRDDPKSFLLSIGSLGLMEINKGPNLQGYSLSPFYDSQFLRIIPSQTQGRMYFNLVNLSSLKPPHEKIVETQMPFLIKESITMVQIPASLVEAIKDP